MKKHIAIVSFFMLISCIAFGQRYTGEAKLIDDTVDGTVYIGIHKTTENTTTISTTNSKWYIKRIVTTTNGTEIAEAWSSNTEQPQWSNKWSERASTNTTYKAAQ